MDKALTASSDAVEKLPTRALIGGSWCERRGGDDIEGGRPFHRGRHRLRRQRLGGGWDRRGRCSGSRRTDLGGNRQGLVLCEGGGGLCGRTVRLAGEPGPLPSGVYAGHKVVCEQGHVVGRPGDDRCLPEVLSPWRQDLQDNTDEQAPNIPTLGRPAAVRHPSPSPSLFLRFRRSSSLALRRAADNGADKGSGSSSQRISTNVQSCPAAWNWRLR